MKQRNIIILIIVLIAIFFIGKWFIRNREKKKFIEKCEANKAMTFMNVDCEAEWIKQQAK